MPKIFEGAARAKKYVAGAIVLGIIFWLLEFAYQMILIGNPITSVVRGSALTAATLIGISLLISPLARLFPSRNYIRHRRTIGVLGFTFAIIHACTVVFSGLYGSLGSIFFSINPYEAPAVFGLLAFIIFIPIYLTSTDWAVAKLSYQKWKAIHRLVYIAFIITVLHFILVNPPLLMNAFGYLLLAVAGLVFMFEIAAFIDYTRKKAGQERTIGALIILAGAILFCIAYAIDKNGYVAPGAAALVIGVIVIYIVSRPKKTATTPGAGPAIADQT